MYTPLAELAKPECVAFTPPSRPMNKVAGQVFRFTACVCEQQIADQLLRGFFELAGDPRLIDGLRDQIVHLRLVSQHQVRNHVAR